MADVRFSIRAQISLAAHDDYLRPLNPAAADRVLTEIERSCRLLAEFPQLGRRIEGTALLVHVTRRFGYRVIYRLAGNVVEIREVLHPRQST